MARTRPRHKAQYDNFIHPNYGQTDDVNEIEITKVFQRLSDDLIQQIPDEGEPADGYMYNSHMGAFLRTLDQAKDHYVKALLAFWLKRGPRDPTRDGSLDPTHDVVRTVDGDTIRHVLTPIAKPDDA